MSGVTVKFNKKKACDSFNAYCESLKKAGVAIKAFVVHIQHTAEATKEFYDKMDALTKTEEVL